MRIDLLAASDTPRVLEANSLFDEPAHPGAVREYLADPRNVFFLAMEGPRPVGFLRGTSLRQPQTRRAQMFLYEIAVAPDRQRKGVGSALVRALPRYCRARQFEEVFVFTDPGNVAAVNLYVGTGARTETPADRMYVYTLASKRRRTAGGRGAPPDRP